MLSNWLTHSVMILKIKVSLPAQQGRSNFMQKVEIATLLLVARNDNFLR